jgi:multiple sugar transport system ATP-binding protein
MKVRDNLAFGLRRRGFPKAEIAARVERAAAMLGLTPYLDRRPHALSGGQRQRVALGRAVVRDPKVFLFDEPLSNLDAALRVSTRNELIKQHQRLGATMIYVTHDQVEAMTMGTRICIMNGGRVVQLGPPLDVYRDPADTFVARFLGNPPMNLVPSAIERAGDGLAARLGGRTLPLRGWSAAALPSSSAGGVILGLRPEDLYEVRPAGVEGPFALVPVRVEAVEPLGAETLLVVTPEGVDEEVTARVGRDSRARPGDRLELHLDLSAVHLFVSVTTRAIPPDRPAGRA